MANYNDILRNRHLILNILTIVIATIISLTIPFLEPYGIAIVAIVGIIGALVPQLQELTNQFREERATVSLNTRYLGEVRNFMAEKVVLPTVNLAPNRNKSTRQEVYRDLLKKSFPQLKPIEMDALVLLCLCKQTEILPSTESIEVYSTVQNYLDILGLHRITQQNRVVFSAYRSLFESDRKFRDIIEIFQGHPARVTRNAQKDFLDRFSKDAAFDYIKRELRQSEELRKTLLELIKTGQLDTYGVKEEALHRLKDAFARRALSRGAYLILGNKLPKQLKQKFRTYPNLGGFMAWSHVPKIRPVRITGYVIKPDKSFNSPKEFFTQEIQPILGVQQKDMILVIFSLDILNLESYSYPPTAEFSSEFMHDCYASIKHITEGYAEDVSIWKTITESKITTEELLSIIPFNIFVPDIVESEREFIVKNYRQIKQQLSVRTLADWKNKAPSDMVQVILSIGRPTYNSSEATILFGTDRLDRISETRIRGRLRRISNEIVTNARRFSRSLRF